MSDLVCMLKEKSLGVNIASEIINCLLFADDIVLIGKTEDELQALLDVASEFASKWNLKFNASKSKVLITGKKLDRNKQWFLGGNVIDEVNEYKYLGVFFSRSLKFSYHIEQYLKESFNKTLHYTIRVLGEHGDFNRINFGDALWTSVIRPSITYGCAVWFPTLTATTALLESWQYQVGKVILNTKMNFPKCALLSEFGWEPMISFMERQRIA